MSDLFAQPRTFFRKCGVLFLSSLVFSQTLFASEIASPGTPARKLQRGFLNIALSPVEISTEMAKEKKNDTMPPGWLLGLGRGACYAAGRALTGAFEILTFLFSFPGHYDTILDPEFPWEHFDSQK